MAMPRMRRKERSTPAHEQPTCEAPPALEVLIFSSHDNVTLHRRARALQSGLTNHGILSNVYDKLGSDFDELLQVAKHRVVSTPTTVVYKHGAVVARLLRLPSTREARALLARLTSPR